MQQTLELLTLFAAAFGAATILPFQSEFLLAAMQYSGRHNAVLLVAVATIGNVLGAVVNWWLGKYLLHFQDRRWFPVKAKHMEKATKFYQKWGVWSLLLSWAPFGDPLTLVAGVMRTNIWLFLLLVTIGKMGRYIAVVMII